MGKGLIVTGVLCWLVLALTAAADTEQTLLGDGDDGNRTIPVHLIPLYDADGIKIRANDEKPQPFSVRRTCSKCHDYQTISGGWHFNSADPNVPEGRPGEPWVLVDSETRTQMPISGRPWPGTFKPVEVGITPWRFLRHFSTHMPGGGYGEIPDDKDMQAILKGQVAGSYEINCLTCHNADRSQNQSDAALHALLQNYKWVATGSCGFAEVKGSIASLSEFFDPEFDEIPITVSYDKSRFNETDEVFIDIIRRPPVNRCYFCHSTQDMAKAGQMEWTRDEDVHLAAGLTCLDCHRNGLDHIITRGVEGKAIEGQEASVTTLSCKGCHLGDETANEPVAVQGGRLGAPQPEHPGIPPVHFERLMCTACHSGNWPEKKAGLVKTARIHKLGLHDIHRVDLELPHIAAPIFVKGQNGKIAPHKMLWPAFWGRMKDKTVVPLMPEVVREVAKDVLGLEVESTETVNGWRPLKPTQITEILKLLKEQQAEQGEAVYVCGGKLYRITEKGKLEASEHKAARPYSWAIAHDVRPAAQSLGVRRCEDCHSTDAPFFFGAVAIDSPIAAERDSVKKMVEFQDIDAFYAWAFAFSFVFRPWLKVVALGSCAVLAVVLLLYALKALACIVKVLAEEG